LSTSTLPRRLAVAFVALAVLTGVGVALAVAVAARQRDALNRVTGDLFTSYRLAAELGQALTDQETGFRGYALTGDEVLLDPYRGGFRSQEQVLRRMRGIDRRRPDVQDRLRGVTDAAASWRASVVQPGFAIIADGGRLSTADVLRGKAAFDRVRAAVGSYQQLILIRRNASVRELRRVNAALLGVFGGSVALLVVIAALSWLALRRWVTDPLGRLGVEVERVEAGELSHQVAMSEGPLEIRVLAGQVDRMRMHILEEYAVALEARAEAVTAQQQVEAQAEDLRRSNAELEQFAYVASHDLQEPLRKVASFCQLLERRYKGQLDERADQYIEFAVDGAKRMQRLISDLLAFSRVGRLTDEFVPVDLEDTFAQALHQLAALIEEAGALVDADPLPTVSGDPTLLVQLLQNLIGNGVKFRGEQPPRVHLAVTQVGSDWEFRCSDNGIGIEPQYADKIFVIFQRLHGRDAYDGTGIGLAVCKKIVEFHGGRIWLDPTVPGGTTFRWTIPAIAGIPVIAAEDSRPQMSRGPEA